MGFRVRRFLACRSEDICVDIEGPGRRGVAEHPLQGFHVCTGRDGKARGGVAEIVGGHPRELRVGGREVGNRAVETSPPELGIPKYAAHRRGEQAIAPVFP